MKTKIQIKSIYGIVLFEFEKEDNTIKATLIDAVKNKAYLRGADLSDAYLRGAYLSGAYLRGADLSDAYLRGADLSGAYLSDADLSGANLRGANLSGAKLKDSEGKEFKIEKCVQILGLKYNVFLFQKHMKIGCECYSYENWWKFPDKDIIAMDKSNALNFWKVWKSILRKMSENI